jgi:excisionase family DNA binding protein
MAVDASAGDNELDAFDIAEVCRRGRFGRSFIYEQIRCGALVARKYGRLTRILRRDFDAWLAAAPAIAPCFRIGPEPAPEGRGHEGRRAAS